MAAEGAQVLSEGAGYGVVLGIGFAFAFLMMGLSAIQNRYTNFKIASSEEFNTASRSIKPGLIASSIVSAWTWAATLLQSCTVTYEYGISGGYYYAAGSTVQIFLMSVLAVRLKMIAPYCHTYLEIIHARYGSTAHCIFVLFGLVANLMASTMLLIGGSAVVNALTGMNIYVANVLIPVGVTAYVITGGLRATFISDYTHTTILWIILLYFMLYAYSRSEMVGGLEGMYNLLVKAGEDRPAVGSQNGSYLTFKTNGGLVFMFIQFFGAFGAVNNNQGYWQRAIASKTNTVMYAYLMGGFAWFAVPMAASLAMGLTAVALASDPRFVYAGGLSEEALDAGLAGPAAVVTILGKGGAVAMLIVLFVAVTAAASAEMIGTSSVLTYDIYQLHFNPQASSAKLIRVSHLMILIWVVIMSGVACIWIAIGVSLNWLYLFAGTLYTPATGPIVLSVLWRKQTRAAALGGALGGLAIGVMSWLVVAKAQYGELTMITTSGTYPMLAGNAASCVAGFVIPVVVTLIKPDNEFDWTETRNINPRGRNLSHEELLTSPRPDANTKPGDESTDASPVPELTYSDYPAKEYEALRKTLKTAAWYASVISFIMIFLIPIPLFLSHYIFSLNFFKAWIIITIIWLFVAAILTSVLPVWESRSAIFEIGRKIVRDVCGRSRRENEDGHGEISDMNRSNGQYILLPGEEIEI